MAGLHVPRPLRIVRTAPAVLVVLPVPQCVKRLLPSRSRDIQALAGLKIAARRQDMHVDPPARFAVLDRCPGVAVRFQPRPGGFLELVQHAANLRIARFVLRCPGDDARRVLVLELKCVGHVGHLVRIAPQHFDFFRVLLRVPALEVHSIEVTLGRHETWLCQKDRLRYTVEDGEQACARSIVGESGEVALRNEMVSSCDVLHGLSEGSGKISRSAWSAAVLRGSRGRGLQRSVPTSEDVTDDSNARLTASGSFSITCRRVAAGPLTRRVPCSHFR